jgi:hypothetical protein
VRVEELKRKRLLTSILSSNEEERKGRRRVNREPEILSLVAVVRGGSSKVLTARFKNSNRVE